MQLEHRTWTLTTRAGVVEIEPGDTAAADAGIRTDPSTLNALLLDPGGLDAALSTGAAETEGDLDALRRLLAAASHGS